MATPAKQVQLGSGPVAITIGRGLNNGVSFGFQVWDPATGQFIGQPKSGSIHPLDPSPTQRYSLGAPGPLKGKRLVIAYRLTIMNPGEGNTYRIEAAISQGGHEIAMIDYDTEDADENGVYNELNAFFV